MRLLPPLLFCLTCAAPASILTHSAEAQTQRSIDPRRETAERMLKPITVSFQDARLDDVMMFISDYTGATLDVLWLDDRSVDGLDPQRTVSIDVDHVTALTLLERVLKRGYDGFEGATWQFAETGELEVGPKSRLNARATLKMYDIRDLLFTVEAFTDVPDLGLGQIIQGQGGGGNVDIDFEDRPRLSDEEEAQKIIDLVVAYIEPDQWRDNGGDGGSISYYNGHLLVRAPDYMHRQLIGYSFWPTDTGAATSRASDRRRPAPEAPAEGETEPEVAESNENP